MILAKAGSKHETKEINGISHFLEHLCFKGTKKRRTQLEISSELDGLGAEFNAFTGHEYTGYFAKVRNENFGRILDIVSDIYLNPLFDPKEIEKERGPIIEEINMYEDIPMRKVQELFIKVLYGDQPAGWSIAGRKNVVLNLKRKDFIRYKTRHYTARNTVLVVAGGYPETNVREKIESVFSSLEKGEDTTVPKVKELQQKPAELIQFKESDQAHIIMGFRTFNIFDRRRFVLEVLADILGGGMSSRLFQKIRSELGAAYYIDASADLYADHGFVAASAGVDNTKVGVVVKSIIQEFKKLKDKKVSQKELKRSKEHLIGGLILSLETSDKIGYFYGGQAALGLKLLTPDELIKRISSVTASQIQSAAKSIFKNAGLNLALIGPFKKERFVDILRI